MNAEKNSIARGWLLSLNIHLKHQGAHWGVRKTLTKLSFYDSYM